ncbi:MAG: hypothetical protein H7X97_06065 [Opitutaceae bacterium]|nr:hypothetical protein [Verrucomicrobiales bacterium]
MDSQRLARCLRPGLLFLALLMAGYVMVWVTECIRRPNVLEYREGAITLLTDLQLSGRNPYLLEDRPAVVSIYGIGYQWAMRPFASVLGGSLQTHRLVSCAFILLNCAVLAWVLRKDRTSWMLVIPAVAFWFMELGQGLSIVARPDSFGMFLFLGSLAIPYCLGFTTASLVVSAGFSILGFYTKPYFLLGLPLMALFLFLHQGKLKGVVFFAISIAVLAATVPLINAAYPAYFSETFFISRNAATRSWSHLQAIGGGYLRQHLVLLIVLVIAFVAGLTAWWRLHRGQWRSWLSFLPLSAPLLASSGNLPGLALAVASTVMVLMLGLHQGNGILYYHQIISPFLLWLVFRFAARLESRQGVVLLLILVHGVLYCRELRPLPADDRNQWQRLEQLVTASTNAFLPPPLAWIARQQGKPVYDGGQTEFSIRAYKGNFTKIGPLYEKRISDYWAGIISGQIRQDFDYMLVTPGLSPFVSFRMLNEHYVFQETLIMPMVFDSYPVDLWRPKGRVP